MKTTFICLIALGVAVAMASPADRALAGEPMVLTDAELDRVTAGSHPPEFKYVSVRLSPPFGEAASITFGDGVHGARSVAWGDSMIQILAVPSPDIEVIAPAVGRGR
jgi:hypothetical protein